MKKLLATMVAYTGVGVLGILAIAGILALAAGFIGAVFCLEAWILQFCWAIAVPAVLPGVVAAGTIPAALTFIQSLATVVILSLVGGALKSRTTVTKG